MSSNDPDTGVAIGKPPIVTPRTSSLQAQTGRLNGQEQANTMHDSESVSSGSEGEKERVREKLKKTSIAGIRSESQSREVETVEVPEQAVQSESNDTKEPKEKDLKMAEADDKSELSDDSVSSQGSRKRSREPEDDGEDIASDFDNDTSPILHTRKRSRELSDEPEEKGAQQEGSEQKSDDESMTQSQPDDSRQTGEGAVTPPPAKMDEDIFASPGRRLDGRKRGREEADADISEDKIKTKKPAVKDSSENGTSKESPMGEPTGSQISNDNTVYSPTKGISRQGTPVDPAKASTPEPTKIPPGSGFANTSAKSPFATAGAGAKPLFGSATTNTLFASSKFGVLAANSASPFATLGSTPGTPTPFGSPKPPPSPFAGSSTPSGLGGLGGFGGSGFGGFGQKAAASGFGALKSGADVISSSPKQPLRQIGASKPAKPFGAPEDYSDEEGSDDEEGDDDESGDEENTRKEKEPKASKSEAFHETEVVTGEENEVVVCHFRAKTYHYDKAAASWKERGVGTLKLLASKLDLNDLSDDTNTPIKRKYRLVMRADAVHKVILNVPVTEELIKTYGDQGKLPTGNNFRLLGLENGDFVTLLIKLRNPTDSRMLYTHILESLLGHEAASLKIDGQAA